MQTAPATPDDLSAIGVRVRAGRARRGMTRKDLAAASGLSQRFLADVEAGRGNVSIHSLQAVAQALGIALLDLLRDAPSPALAGVLQLLARLDDAQLDQAQSLLSASFDVAGTPGREQRVALLGLRGAGKSTLGARLAADRGLPFVELDREVEREAGTSMQEIWLLYGEAGYRRLERRALLRIAEQHAGGVVLATGGSIVGERETFELLRSRFHCVWLKATAQEHMGRVVAQGDMRPFDVTRGANAQALQDIHRILSSRADLYARADAVVDTAGRSVRQSLRDLAKAVQAIAAPRSASSARSKER